MQSFSRERSGFHGNQPCYQQEHHELSRLESYRQHPHHGQTRQVYEAHALATATGMPPAGPGAGPGPGSGPIPGPKDCYSQQAYPGYPQGNGGGVGGGGVGGGGGSTPHDKKAYSGGSQGPPPTPQHMQAGGYSNHMGPGGYPAQYMSEGHLQQSKWDDPVQLAQYEQEMVGRMEPGPPGSSQYLDQNMLAHSQSQCHQTHQASAPVYTSPHHQPHPANPGQSSLMYPQSQLHYPQHPPSPSPSSSSYMEKCSPMPHCYKGYSMPPSSQYTRQMGSHSGLKQGGYRPPPQNSYSYQQTPSRGGYEPQPTLQGMPTPQETHPKYQHFSQPQQNYCLSELSVRSPEQYYQTCSPASSHSPARSVGRSPSYSSTPSPLMTNPESFQYSQPPMTPGAASSSSSSSAGLQDQGLLMPPRSHPSSSPNVAHPTPQHSYTQGVSMKERFSEKLLANPSLWSLNALTSQVENISNNVQQLLLSEAMVANKKGGKRSSIGSSGGSSSKKEEVYKGVPGGPEGQHGGGPMQDPYSTNQHQLIPMEMQEGGYSSSSDEQLERGYYYCGQGRSPAQAPNNAHLGLDTASSCSMTSPDDMSTRSGDSVSGLQSVASRDNMTPDPRSQGGHEPRQTPMKSVGDERSPVSVTIPSPMKQESQSPPDIQRLGLPLKENFEELAWTEKMADYEEDGVKKTSDSESDRRGSDNVTETSEKQEKWPEDEKGPTLYSKINKAVTEGKSYCYDENMYHKIQNKYDRGKGDSADKSPNLSDSIHTGDLGQKMKSEAFKSDSVSSVKTSPFISRGDLDQDQYLTEKEDSSENTSPTPRGEALDQRLSASEKRESREEEEEDEEEGEEERKQNSISPPLSAEEREGEESESLPSTEEVLNNRTSPQEEPSGELCSRTEGQSLAEPQPYSNTEPAETESQAAQPDATAAAAESPESGSAICDTPPQSHSAMMVFSALREIATPPAPSHTRDHIDRSDSNVLEPDSPQLPGKSILHSAPSWANTPPSPKKGDEDMEPGISCPSAVTPSAKPEPVATSAHPQAFGRKHGRGRRRLMHSGVEFRRQLSVEREGESAPSPPQKPCIPSSKSALFSDQIDMAAHQDIITTSETPKLLVEGSRSRMCTRSFNAQDTPSKDPQPPERRKPGRKPGSKPGPKPGPKSGLKPGPKPGLKPGPKPGSKPSLKPGPKPGLKPDSKPSPKPGLKPGPKPGPKPGLKPGPKPGPKPGLKPGPKPTEGAPRGRPRGTGSKLKLAQQEGPIQPITGDPGRGQKSLSINSQQVDGNQEVKAPGKDGKNMVLRSRKPPQDKLPKEKEKEQSEGILTQTLTGITKPNAVLQNEERTSIEPAIPVFPNQTDTSITDTSVTDTSKPDTSVTDTSKPDTSVTDTRVTDPSKTNISVTDTSKPDTSKPDNSVTDTSKTDTIATDVSVTDTSVTDTSVSDPNVTDTSVTDTSATDTSVTDNSLTDTCVTDTSVTDTSVTDTSKTDISISVAPPEKPKEPTVAVPLVTAPVPPLKRKPSPLPLELPVKKKRGPKPKPKQPQPETPQSDQANQANQPPLVKPKEMGVRGPKRRLKRGRRIKASLIAVLTKDNPPPTMTDGDVVSEIPSVPSQCPTKTKYLPPRKGRGLKYEAMVQKINSGTSSKKHPPTPQPESTEATVDEVTSKPVSLPISEESEAPVAVVSAPDVSREELAGDVWSSTGAQNTEQEGRVQQNTGEGVQREPLPSGVPDAAAACGANKPTRTKRRKWAMVESTDATVVAMETGSLIINTPRLAKQRAIKNNHEMHLKQRRRKRKGGQTPSEGPVADEEVETTTGDPQTETPADTALTTTPALPAGPGEITDSPQVIATEMIQPPPSKRGRKTASSPSKKRGRAPGEQQSSKPLRVHKKPGPKKGIKDAMEVIEAVVKAAGREARLKKKKWKKDSPVVSEEKQPEPSLKQVLSKTPKSRIKPSFCPYVRMDSSRDFTSLCTIVNRRDEELKMVLQKPRKKSPDKIKNPVTFAKAIPSSSAMLQGPLVNKTLIDRCLTCCLCGKPANYRELGDLCGPYFPEDSIPRKILSARHIETPRENQEKISSNSSIKEPTSSTPKSEGDPSSKMEVSKKVDMETVTKEGSSSSGGSHHHQPHPHHWRPRRAERALAEGGSTHRPTLRDRFRRMQKLQEERRAAEATASGQKGGNGGGGLLQRLQEEAEAKEHWAHENCAIWTNGIIMVAGRLYGLKEAVHTSTETSCSKCQRVGASISCCWKGCPHKYHYICAKEIGCMFQDDNFSLKCPKHEAL
ncbi:retinoic acid-induced protein 1-like [Salmo salar]|uniref:Retinoic acid-induced protein 1-like n=1 Tax=Salmo salar TaxID=8030 RepID=A0ABM3EXX0_SALSA|nr:retinoic acid-induced protein 1-like [Salmo salar]